MIGEEQKRRASTCLTWEITQTVGKKLNGQKNPDFGQVRSQLNTLIAEWFDKPREEMSIDELWEAQRRVRNLGDFIQGWDTPVADMSTEEEF